MVLSRRIVSAGDAALRFQAKAGLQSAGCRLPLGGCDTRKHYRDGRTDGARE